MLKKNRFAMIVTASAVFLAAGSLTALAQGVITQKVLSIDAAQAVARAALDKCHADGYRVSVSVVDASGLPIAFLRDDEASPATIDFSRRKAYTALAFRMTSAEIGKIFSTVSPAPNITDFAGVGGGVPIKAGNNFVGGVGVSGAPGGEKDEACANAGIAKIALELK
jgi:uncharacterized protein GlcG (DUF336 family)